MYDQEILQDLLGKMQNCVEKIQIRFKSVMAVSDLTDSPEGVDRLDLLCMPLIIIGELVKKIDHMTDNKFLERYPEIPWGEIKGMRNIVAHDYFNIDAVEIFDTCKNDIPKLAETLCSIISEMERAESKNHHDNDDHDHGMGM